MVGDAQGVKLRLLLVVGLVATGVGWIVQRLLTSGGRALPSPSWLTIAVFVAVAVGLLLAGRPVRRLVAGTATRPVSPLFAARILALAQAAALAGALVAGWYLASALLLLPDLDVESQRGLAVQFLVLALGSGGMAAVGMLVQRWCRVDASGPGGRPGGKSGGAAGGRQGGSRDDDVPLS